MPVHVSQSVQQGFLAFNQLAVLAGSSVWASGIYLLFDFYLNSSLNGDSVYLKSLVAWLGLMDTLRLLCTAEQSHAGTIWVDRNASSEDGVTPDELIDFGNGLLYLASALVAIPSQVFFVFRIWNFTGRPLYIPLLVIPLLLFQLVFPIVILADISDNAPFLFVATCAVIAFVDVASCVRLTFILWRKYVTRDSVLRSSVTTSLLLRLLLLSINTGLWTAIVALFLILEVLLFLPTSSVPFLGYYHMLSPIHFVTVLINLNSRSYVRDVGSDLMSFHTSQLRLTELRESRTTAERSTTRTQGRQSQELEGWVADGHGG